MSVIRTVAGDLATSDFTGACLAHEHLLIDLRNQAARDALERKVTVADRAALMTSPYSMKDNLVLDDMEAAAEECRELLTHHCDLVVDCSTAQIGRNPQRLLELSRSTGMRIVMGCGYYTGDTYPATVAERPREQLAEEMLLECEQGTVGVRPGVLGELGTSREILPNERRVLEAAALVQKRTNLGVQVHTYPWGKCGLEAVGILLAGGVPPEKISICHADVMLGRDYIEALLRLGVFVEFDNFGKEFTPAVGNSFAGGAFATDMERVALFSQLFKDGWGPQLLMTNDLCLKCMLKRYGGKGYGHVFQGIPVLMQNNGLAPQEWQPLVMHDNPLRFLEV